MCSVVLHQVEVDPLHQVEVGSKELWAVSLLGRCLLTLLVKNPALNTRWLQLWIKLSWGDFSGLKKTRRRIFRFGGFSTIASSRRSPFENALFIFLIELLPGGNKFKDETVKKHFLPLFSPSPLSSESVEGMEKTKRFNEVIRTNEGEWWSRVQRRCFCVFGTIERIGAQALASAKPQVWKVHCFVFNFFGTSVCMSAHLVDFLFEEDILSYISILETVVRIYWIAKYKYIPSKL
ncbi:hypothetical protein NE237_018405 [Protea cynaroides]|uniref:Uncharacterized protein n=1 Tax=Protea cynaroides TaxID=273540 RepID=A0A9Q0K9Z5_9MAGN|nr:hypothetical protein NE237_018405 [Protea cynaroides]